MKHCVKSTGAALLALVISASFISNATAQNTNLSGTGSFSLQGRLLKTDGSAIANGQHQLSINIYKTGVTQAAFTETESVTTADGIFSTMINSAGSSNLNINGRDHYEIGVAVDGGAEMLPHISIGKTLQAITASVADTAASALSATTALTANTATTALNANTATTATTALNANAVGGFHVDSLGLGLPHSLATLNNSGKLSASVLDSSIVTSVNGAHGAVNIMGGGNLTVATSHDNLGTNINLGFTGSGAGLLLPFSQTVSLALGDAFSISNALAGNAGAFVNTGLGNALRAVAATGSALVASSTGAVSGAAAINASSTLGTAINATSGSNSAITASGSSATNAALAVTNSAAGATAAKLNGGLSLVGPIGTGMITSGQNSVVISNAYAKANSMIFVTLTSGATTSVPLTVTSSGAGTFTVAAVGGNNVTSNVSFNYLIVNQQ